MFPDSKELKLMFAQQVWSELIDEVRYFIILTQMRVNKENKVNNIPVVGVFLDVFPEEVLGLPYRKK